MQRFLLFLLLLGRQCAFGQFSDSVSKITFYYNKGYYTFGRSGPYSASEIIEYTRANDASFQITSCLRFYKSYDSATNITKTDTIIYQTSATIPGKKMETLFTELNTPRDNFNPGFIRPYLKKPSKKEILSTAVKYDRKWMFDKHQTDKAERRNLFKRIRQFVDLDTFLFYMKPDPTSEIVVTDVWHKLVITCYTNTGTIEYHMAFTTVFGQPVERYENKDYLQRKKIVNLQVNKAISNLMPSGSLIHSAVGLNEMNERYIGWYLQNAE